MVFDLENPPWNAFVDHWFVKKDSALVFSHDAEFFFEFLSFGLHLSLFVRLRQDCNEWIQHNDWHQNHVAEQHDESDGFVVGQVKVAHVEISHDPHAEYREHGDLKVGPVAHQVWVVVDLRVVRKKRV